MIPAPGVKAEAPTTASEPVQPEPDPTGSEIAWQEMVDNSGDTCSQPSAGWNDLNCYASYKGGPLGALPSEKYPNANPAGSIFLMNNDLREAGALSSIQTIGGSLIIYGNGLRDVSGLGSLWEAGNLRLFYPTSAQLNAIDDFTPIQNVDVSGGIDIQTTYYGPKLPADSRFCRLNTADQFKGATDSGYGAKSLICQP